MSLKNWVLRVDLMFDFFKKNKEHSATINVGSEAIELTVEKGKTLLNAALKADIAWPHKCKVGSCGSCKSQIVSGKIKPQIDFSYVLSPEELKQGYVLACQSELKSDIKVNVRLRKKRKV